MGGLGLGQTRNAYDLVPIVAIVIALRLVRVVQHAREARYARQGDVVDDGRGLPIARKPVTGSPVTFVLQGVELHGVIFDNEAGGWARAHIPLRAGATRMGSKGFGYVVVEFGDKSVAEEVRSLSVLQGVRPSDITVSRELFSAELELWDTVSHPHVPQSCMRVGRLDYASIELLRCIRVVDDEPTGLSLRCARAFDPSATPQFGSVGTMLVRYR